MKLGIFDSGIGGLIITKAIIDELPDYDYLYLGDTAHLPYGNRPSDEIYKLTRQAIDYLLKQDCAIVVIACNTASAEALHRIQQEYLPAHFPDRKVLGVIIPTVEEVLNDYSVKRIGILATDGTAKSEAYVREIQKIRPYVKVIQQPAPLLVPLIEHNEIEKLNQTLETYLKPFIEQKVDSIILGCTHYALVKVEVRIIVDQKIEVVSQDEIIPDKFVNYLNRHPEIENKLTRNRIHKFVLTKHHDDFSYWTKRLFGRSVKPEIAYDYR